MCAFRFVHRDLSEAEIVERTKLQQELEHKFAYPNPVPVYRDLHNSRDDQKKVVAWGREEIAGRYLRDDVLEEIWRTYEGLVITPRFPTADEHANHRRGPGRPRNLEVLSYPLPKSEMQARSDCSFTPDLVGRFYEYLELFTDRLARPSKRSNQRREWRRTIRKLAKRCAIEDIREILDGPEGCYFLTEPLFALNKMQRREMRDAADWTEKQWLDAWEIKLDNFVSARGRERPKEVRRART